MTGVQTCALPISNNLNNLNEDKQISEELITIHENVLKIKYVNNKSFEDIKNKIFSVINREIHNLKQLNEKDLNITESKKVILDKKTEQLNLINDKDDFKEELRIQKNKIELEIQTIENEVSTLSNQIISITEKIKYLNDDNRKLSDSLSINNVSTYGKKINKLNEISVSTSKLFKQLKDSSELLREIGRASCRERV